MDKLVKTLGIDSLSKSKASRMAADQVEQFRHRPWVPQDRLPSTPQMH